MFIVAETGGRSAVTINSVRVCNTPEIIANYVIHKCPRTKASALIESFSVNAEWGSASNESIGPYHIRIYRVDVNADKKPQLITMKDCEAEDVLAIVKHIEEECGL